MSRWSQPRTSVAPSWSFGLEMTASAQFLGAFAKSGKTIIRFIMSACPLAWNNWPPNRQIFMTFDI
jgi:hypothetical protein